MKTFFALLLLSASALASSRHVVMVSDSRGNCAFAHQMMEHFYSGPNISFRIVSAGGSAPRHWIGKNRWTSPLGHDTKGSSDAVPAKIPANFKLDKTKTPYLPELLQSEGQGHEKLLTIINLGTNESDVKVLKKDALAMVRAVQASNSSCVWVTPPHATRFPLSLIQDQTAAIREAIAEAGPDKNGETCQVIESLKITHYPFTQHSQGIDGVHYCWNKTLIDLGHKWADDAFAQITFFK